MSTALVILAQQAGPPDLLSTPLRTMGGTTSGVWILLAALTGVTLLVFVWAAFLRKRRRHGWRHSSSHHSSRNGHSHSAVHTTEAIAAENRSRGKRRRRRRAHRPRNPTLAETGGLPPIRTERPPEPFP